MCHLCLLLRVLQNVTEKPVMWKNVLYVPACPENSQNRFKLKKINSTNKFSNIH